MGKVLYYDYSALIILILLLGTTIYRGMDKSRAQQVYLKLVVLGILATIADIGAVLLDRMGMGYLVQKHIAHSLYLILHNMSTPLYMIYLIVLSDTDHKFKRLQRIGFSMPFLVMLVATLTNPWHLKLYYFDEFENYTRGPIFWILYASVIFYVVFGIYHLVKQKVDYEKGDFLALSFVFVIMFSAMIAQFVQPKLLCEMLANALGLMLISAMLQRPEQYIDTSTGLGKESAYASSMKRILTNEKPCTMIMVNIKNSESLHSMLGYSSMVEVIANVSKSLQQLNSKENYKAEPYYLGGGKFRLILDQRYAHRADEMAAKIIDILAEGVSINEMNIHLVSVVCIVRCGVDVTDMDSMMVFGNELAKQETTGKVLHAKDIYENKNYDLIRDIDEVVERALTKGSLEVYYQPIYCVKEGRYNSAEALLRLKDEKYGFVPPDIFITAAEQSGSIHQIGAFVLEEVCKFIASEEYKSLGLDYIEINLSVVQCMRSDLAEEVLHIMNKYQVRPDQINLEITETAASYSQKALRDNIISLTEQGIRFSLDDYGTGYSNMRRIASMPFDIIKLDKSFAVAEDNPRMRIVLENTIRMIKAMEMQIVVEGIETEQLARQFSDLECEYIQGYYYSRPIPRQEFVSFLKAGME